MRLSFPVAWLLLVALAASGWRHGLPGSGNAPINPPIAVPSAAAARTAGPALPAFLPPEARATVALIQRGGPFPHAQDGSVFGNYEGHLPSQPRGWYHEYTVPTPGARNRGTRRIVTGGTPPREWYYTDDHYASFRRFDVP
ncbi:MAG: ribonuclease domain-containing protein [Thermomonas haemolytica]